MKNLLCLLFTMFVAQLSFSQQTGNYTQGADEFGLSNPAGLSIEEMRFRGHIFTGYLRSQWLGSTGGYPRAQAFTWLNNTPKYHQIGCAFLSEQIGETKQFELRGRYAHSVGKYLKIGLSAGLHSENILTANLDRYDPDDPLFEKAGENLFSLSFGVGAFFSRYDLNRTWNWFAGISMYQRVYMNAPGEAPSLTQIGAQGGFGRNGWWLAGRMRIGERQPGALDVLLRKYLDYNRFFLGCLATADPKHQTLGLQAGYERALNPKAKTVKPFLTFIAGMSKPISAYIQGNNLIFDFRVVWSQHREKIEIRSPGGK